VSVHKGQRSGRATKFASRCPYPTAEIGSVEDARRRGRALTCEKRVLQHMLDVENTVELMMARLDELSGMLEAVRCSPPTPKHQIAPPAHADCAVSEYRGRAPVLQLNIQTVQQRTDLEPQLTQLAQMLAGDYEKIDKTAVRTSLDTHACACCPSTF
jgi:hypothetical protein